VKRMVFGFIILIGFGLISCAGTNELNITNEELRKENEILKDEISSFKDHNERLMPVTWEIVEKADEKTLKELNYYVSAPLRLVTNNREPKFTAKNGVLDIENNKDFKEVIIQSTSKGKIQSPNPKGNESLEVYFEENDIVLKFNRDKAKNNFVFVGIIKSSESLNLPPDGIPPYLCVEYNKNGNMYQMVSNLPSAAQEPNVGVLPSLPNDNSPLPSLPAPPVPPSLPRQVSRNIMGLGILTKESIVEYILLKNKIILPEKIEEIVRIYIEESLKENINHDIAIVQMCEGTKNLSKTNVWKTNNFGDLQYLRNRSAVNSFPTVQLGIRAHVQQLKAYADPRGPVGQKVDRIRIGWVGKNSGKITTLDQLFPVWVTKNLNEYKNEINTIFTEIQIFHAERNAHLNSKDGV